MSLLRVPGLAFTDVQTLNPSKSHILPSRILLRDLHAQLELHVCPIGRRKSRDL